MIRSRHITKLLRREDGQTVVVTAVFLAVLIGMAAMVIDIGSWYRSQRQLQATADSAALAAAQALPNTSDAAALAVQYGNKNGGGVSTGDITFSSTSAPNDTIAIRARRQAPGIFTKLFGLSSISLGAKAKARESVLASVRWISPLAISEQHPMLHCSGGPCYGTATELSYHHPGSAPKDPLSVVYVNLIADKQQQITESYIAKWIRDGFDVEKSTGAFVAFGTPTYLSPEVKAALESRFGDVVILPVIRTFGKNQYDVVSWAAFKITGLGRISEHHWRIYGSFVPDSAQGTSAVPGSNIPNYGVHSIALVE